MDDTLDEVLLERLEGRIATLEQRMARLELQVQQRMAAAEPTHTLEVMLGTERAALHALFIQRECVLQRLNSAAPRP
jgi:hypothetical protein